MGDFWNGFIHSFGWSNQITLERIPEFEAFGFLLSDAVPVRDGADHFWTSWKEKIKFWRK